MIKLSKVTQDELICLCGLCDHEPYDKNCHWVKMLDAPDPNLYQFKAISRIIKTETTLRLKKNANTKTKSKRK